MSERKLVVWIDNVDDSPRPEPETDEWVQCCDADGEQLGYMSEKQSVIDQEVKRLKGK